MRTSNSETEYNSKFSEFIRNASDEEKKLVYDRVMKQATEDQKALLEAYEKRILELEDKVEYYRYRPEGK